MPPTKSEPKVFDDEESLCAAVQAILLEDVEELQAPDLDAEATAAALGSAGPTGQGAAATSAETTAEAPNERLRAAGEQIITLMGGHDPETKPKATIVVAAEAFQEAGAAAATRKSVRSSPEEKRKQK